MIEVDETNVTEVPAIPPKLTVSPLAKPVPVKVTVVPLVPTSGLIEVTVGATTRFWVVDVFEVDVDVHELFV